MNLLRVPGVEHASRLKIPELSGETKAHANFSVFPQAQLGSASLLTFLNHSNSIILKSFSMLSQLAHIVVITNHVSYNQNTVLYHSVFVYRNKTFNSRFLYLHLFYKTHFIITPLISIDMLQNTH